jgi:RNA polymerase sigma factor (sigma-70 family)
MAHLVERVRQGSAHAIEELYELFRKNAASQVRTRLGGQAVQLDMEDRLHDAFLAALEVIEAGLIREPARIAAFMSTIVRHQINAAIRHVARARNRQFDIDEQWGLADGAPGPETAHLAFEQRKLLCALLQKLDPRGREILGRFYLKEQTQRQICEEMNLTGTQFRLYKSRAKARLRAAADAALGPAGLDNAGVLREHAPRKRKVIELPLRER